MDCHHCTRTLFRVLPVNYCRVVQILQYFILQLHCFSLKMLNCFKTEPSAIKDRLWHSNLHGQFLFSPWSLGLHSAIGLKLDEKAELFYVTYLYYNTAILFKNHAQFYNWKYHTTLRKKMGVHVPWIRHNSNSKQFSKLFLNNHLGILSPSNTVHCFLISLVFLASKWLNPIFIPLLIHYEYSPLRFGIQLL